MFVAVVTSLSTVACAMEPVEGDDQSFSAETNRTPASKIRTIYADANFTAIEDCTRGCVYRTTIRGDFAARTIKAFELVANRKDVIDDRASIGSKHFRCTRATATTPATCLATTLGYPFNDMNRWCSNGSANIVSAIVLRDTDWGDPRAEQFSPLVAASAIDPSLIACRSENGSLVYNSPGGNVCSFTVSHVTKQFPDCSGKDVGKFLGF
jgi:hypothetical protein